jgi:hypothetical protein
VLGVAQAAEPASGASPPPAAAPTEPSDPNSADLAALAARIAALEAQLAQKQEDDLLREAEAAAASAPPPPPQQGAPSMFPLNPGITAFGDVIGQLGVDDGGILPGSTMYLRSLELDIRTQVDPFAKAAAVIAFEQEAPPMDGSEAAGEFEVGPEEVYVDLVALPWHLSSRVGKFKQPFGLMNRTHPHDLPWVDVPASLELLGEEGYNDTGGTLSWVAPLGPLGVTLTAGALSGQPFEEVSGPDAALAGLGRVEAFAGFGSVDVGVGGSVVRHFGLDQQALGGDFSFRWRPNTRRSVVVLAELIRGMDGEMGGYGALQVQPSRTIYLGFREDFGDDGLRHNLFLSHYTSEFMRLRVGGGYAQQTGEIDALAQLTFVWGSHPVEPWWVNK